MMNQFFYTPPIVFALFLGLFTLMYLGVSKYSAKGTDHPEKYLPYSSGQSLPAGEYIFSYKTFFRIGLLFVVLHVSALIISTFSSNRASLLFGVVYLIGMFISAFALAEHRSN
jgi:NADH:ubiquinone oxidoreductase subunit 3 (subunit A)